jgi:hypothetical protein
MKSSSKPAFQAFGVQKKLIYILQKPTPKIKQPTIQLVISQLFQKLKSRSTNKQSLREVPTQNGKYVTNMAVRCACA